MQLLMKASPKGENAELEEWVIVEMQVSPLSLSVSWQKDELFNLDY